MKGMKTIILSFDMYCFGAHSVLSGKHRFCTYYRNEKVSGHRARLQGVYS